MEEVLFEYIKNIEEQIKVLEVKVNSNGSLTSSSRHLIEVNGDKARELTSKLEGFKDALKILGKEK